MLENLQNQAIDWKITETGFFTIKSFVYPTGLSYAEYTSHARVGAWPLVHITLGRSPETGRRKTAKGVIAIGRIALGVLPIGQLAIGLFPIGQLALGLGLALGQGAFSLGMALGQVAVAPVFAAGQIAVAYAAVGQLALGYYCIAQAAVGVHIWTMKVKDPAVLEFFRNLFPWLKQSVIG
jgi:hypothetical protein